MFMDMARAASKRSTCARLNVGAIITLENRPISIGWGGTAAGAEHCPGNSCPGMVPGNCPTLHAEVNALKHIPSSLPKTADFDLYVTHSPCPDCYRAIIDSQRIARLFFEVPYRKTEHLSLLSVTWMKLYQVLPAGYITEYPSGRVVELP